MRCIACGGSPLVGGKLIHSDTDETKFSSDGGSSLKKALLGTGNRPVRAYGCPRCGHLQLAVEFSEDDRKKYQSFEGEPLRSVVDDPGEQ